MTAVLFLLLACESDTNLQKNQPNLAITPAVLDFGGVVREYSATLDLTLLNGGRGALELTRASILEDEAGVFSVGELPLDAVAGDASYALPVTFSPTELTGYTATLSIESNDEDGAQTVVLTGTGIEAPRPDIAVSPMTVDFGAVAAGTPAVQWFTVTNEGDDALTFGNITQTGSGAFIVQTDLDGNTLPAGQSVQVIVLYTPSATTGDNGQLILPSNDPDESSVTVQFLGNGGGDFEYPVAVIDGPATAVPRETLTLDGSGSYDPAGMVPLTYHWSLTGLPDGSDAGENFVLATDRAFLQTDLAGAYEVTLQVENTVGLMSAPTRYRVDAIPEEELHVELTWDTNGADLDLHLLNADGEFFREGDCNWCSRNPSWNDSGSADDPGIDIDALGDGGPENINIDVPSDDNYRVMVHYFEDNGDADVVATVRIYVYGVEEASFSKVLTRNKVWEVADINWPSGAVLEDRTEPYTAPRRNCD